MHINVLFYQVTGIVFFCRSPITPFILFWVLFSFWCWGLYFFYIGKVAWIGDAGWTPYTFPHLHWISIYFFSCCDSFVNIRWLSSLITTNSFMLGKVPWFGLQICKGFQFILITNLDRSSILLILDHACYRISVLCNFFCLFHYEIQVHHK